MTDEEITAAIADAIAVSTTAMVEQMNGAISGAIARTQKDTTKLIEKNNQATLEAIQAEIAAAAQPAKEAADETPPADNGPSLEFKALQQQLAELQQERDGDKAAAARATRDNAILSELGSRKVVSAGILRQLLSAQYGDKLKEEGGQWFVEEGDSATPFKTVVDKFLGSDDGKVFVPVASNVQGNGSRGSNVTPDSGKKGLDTLVSEALRSAR